MDRISWKSWEPWQLIAPRACLVCDEPLTPPICVKCLNLLEVIAGRGCQSCGNPSVHDDVEDCEWCRRLTTLPGRVCTLFAYRQTGRELYQRVKYQGYWRLLEPLVAHAMDPFFEHLNFLDYDCLVPVPEPLSRKVKRQFNPAAQIASVFGRRTGLPNHPILGMGLFAKHQVGQTYDARRKNARRRFHVKNGAVPKSVILVDDVLTTGATLEAATYTLIRAGVKRIAWLALFRTP